MSRMFKEKVEETLPEHRTEPLMGTGFFSQAKYLVTEFCVVKTDVFT